MSRGSTTKSRKSAGSGRAGLRRRSLTLSRVEAALYSCRSGMRKLARRAGVSRVGKGMLDDPQDGALLAFHDWLRGVIGDAVVLTEYARRATVTSNDIVMALKRRGRTLYSTQWGVDWTYGFYNRERVRARIASVRLSQPQLDEAATQIAASQAGSAAAAGGQSVQQEAPGSVQRPAAPRPQPSQLPQQSPARHPQPAQLPQQTPVRQAQPPPPAQSPAPSVAHSHHPQQTPVRHAQPAVPAQSPAPSVAHSAAASVGLATPQSLWPAQQQHEQQQEEQPGAAVVAAVTAAPAAAAAAKGCCGGNAAPASAAPAPANERRLSDVPTPTFLSEARAAEIQNWMADQMLELQRSTPDLGISVHDLRRVMVAKHSCTAAEVQHVLFCLEKMDRIMCEDGMIYPCY